MDDYPLARSISNEYDAPVGAEGLRSMVAVPVVVHREVHAVLYGAVRQRLSLGDRLVAAAVGVARDLERRLTDTDAARAALTTLRAAPAEVGPEWERVRQAHAELRGLLRRIDDPKLRDRLGAVADRLAGAVARPAEIDCGCGKLVPSDQRTPRSAATRVPAVTHATTS